MNRTTVSTFKPISRQEVVRQVAYHEAGHATAIYLRNKKLGLPPVYFQINFKPKEQAPNSRQNKQSGDIWDDAAVIEGGRLINCLPVSMTENYYFDNEQDRSAFLLALEADVVNILAGPLSEAKYTALRDNETFTDQIFNTDILLHYGGAADLQKINEYMECLADKELLRKKKLQELINQALTFINRPVSWFLIEKLAKYIESQDASIIKCEEIITLLEDESTFYQQNKPLQGFFAEHYRLMKLN